MAVRGLHRFLVAEEVRADDPAAEIEMPRVPRGLPKALTLDEVTALIEVVTGVTVPAPPPPELQPAPVYEDSGELSEEMPSPVGEDIEFD